MTSKDWGNVVKFICLVLTIATPFIIWDLVGKWLADNEWARYIVFVVTTAITTYGGIFTIALLQDGKDNAAKIWAAILGVCAIISLFGGLAQIHHFVLKWGNICWFIGITSWIGLIALFTLPFIRKQLKQNKPSNTA